MGVLVGEDEAVKRQGGINRPSPAPPCHPMVMGWLLDGGYMLLWWLLRSERRFGGRFGPSKCMMVDQAIQGSSTSTFVSNRHRSTLEKQCGGSPANQWCGQVASDDVALRAHGPLPRLLAFYARLLSILWIFLHTVDTKIWFERKGPQGQNLLRESQNIQRDWLTKSPSTK
jgi:hypothetical protein